MTRMQRHHNFYLSSVRVAIERSFALLRGRERRLKKLQMRNHQLLIDHISACFVLHNVILLGGHEARVSFFFSEVILWVAYWRMGCELHLCFLYRDFHPGLWLWQRMLLNCEHSQLGQLNKELRKESTLPTFSALQSNDISGVLEECCEYHTVLQRECMGSLPSFLKVCPVCCRC